MGSGEPMVNIRMTPDELADVDAAAQASNQTRSGWGREVLLAAARSLRTLEEILALLAGADPSPARWVRVRALIVREVGLRIRQVRQVRQALCGRRGRGPDV